MILFVTSKGMHGSWRALEHLDYALGEESMMIDAQDLMQKGEEFIPLMNRCKAVAIGSWPAEAPTLLQWIGRGASVGDFAKKETVILWLSPLSQMQFVPQEMQIFAQLIRLLKQNFLSRLFVPTSEIDDFRIAGSGSLPIEAFDYCLEPDLLYKTCQPKQRSVAFPRKEMEILLPMSANARKNPAPQIVSSRILKDRKVKHRMMVRVSAEAHASLRLLVEAYQCDASVAMLINEKEYLEETARADFVLQATYSESFNFTAAVAMSLGTPVIMNGAWGRKNFGEEFAAEFGKHLFVQDVNSPAEIAQRVEDLVKAPEIYLKIRGDLVSAMRTISAERKKMAVGRWKQFFGEPQVPENAKVTPIRSEEKKDG